MKYLATIVLLSGIFLQPFGKMLSVRFFQTHHFYLSTEKGRDGQALTFCGAEKAIHKKIQKDAEKKDESSTHSSHLPDFQIIAHEPLVLTPVLRTSVTSLFGYQSLFTPSQHAKGIFQPPRFTA